MPKPYKSYARIFLFLFFGFSLANLLALTTAGSLDNYFTKPFLMIWLGIYVWLKQLDGLSASGKWMIVGLFFAFLGDTFLLFADSRPSGALFFLLGLGSFLLTHVAYWLAFHNWPLEKKGLLSQRPWLALPFVLYWGVMIFALWPELPAAMKAPVLIYSAVIVLMAMKALHITPGLDSKNRIMLLVGVLLFVVSDSLIALSRFTDYLPERPLFISFSIMITYLAAQLLIILALTFLKKQAI